MRPVAKAEWERVTPILYNAGVLTEVELGVLVSYCDAMAQWVMANDNIKTMQAETRIDPVDGEVPKYPYQALILRTETGSWIQNPLLVVARTARADMVKFAVELGMTPSARSRIKANPPTEGNSSSPGAKFFNG